MLLSEQDAKRRLTSGSNLVNKLGVQTVEHRSDVTTVVQHNFGGREAGRPNLPMFMRATIGALANSGALVSETAKEFAVSERAVKAYKAGETSPGRPNADLKAAVQSKQEEIHDQALAKLMKTLGLLDDEKLANLDAKDLSRVAVNMSQVASNVAPRTPNGSNTTGISVVVYAPPPREESRYKVLDV